MQNPPPNVPQWWVTLDGDYDCLDMHRRHYSRYTYRDGRQPKLFVGPGNKLVLRTADADAVFVWRKFTDDCIDERTGKPQEGVNCAVFRNEGEHLSSRLIRQADAIADAVWTDRRHYTYVDSKKVASENPGYCFIAAGWRRCGVTKGGLIVLERYSKDHDSNSKVSECYSESQGKMAEWTGLEPATPGVTGPSLK